jgi:hypothetical protein
VDSRGVKMSLPEVTISFEQLKDMLFNREACLGCIEEECTADKCIEWKNLNKE